jgi:hypothetical protein
MDKDSISEIRIDDQGRLCVAPESASFPYIYREAMEVQWDVGEGFLYSPLPREWSYARWFSQILEAARMQGVELSVTEHTKWHGLPAESRQEILSSLK